MVTRLWSAGRSILALLILLTLATPAGAFETPARAAILLDLEADQVLFEKNADEPLPTASMSKLMTAFMVFERLEDGRISLDDTFPVSEKAWRKGGSKMFVEVGSQGARRGSACAASSSSPATMPASWSPRRSPAARRSSPAR